MHTVRSYIQVTARTLWAATALLLALATVSGILIAAQGVSLPVPALGAVMLLGMLGAVLARRRRAVWLPGLLVAALALGLWRHEATHPPAGPAGLAFYIGWDVTLTGTVAAEPELLDRGQTVRVVVETLSPVGSAPRRVEGLALVHLATLTPLAYGDRITLGGLLTSAPDLPGSSPGGYRAYLAAQGIYAVLNYPHMRRIGTGGGNPLLALALWLRTLLEGGIKRTLPAPASALLLGILLGTRTRAIGPLTSPFVATGMIHVVAIDGLKVSLLAGAIYWLARRLLGIRTALLPALAALLLYVLVTGATPAGLRSALMWTLALVAIRFGRRSDAVTSLALATALLAVLSPRILWDLGFELSIAGTAAIVLLEPGLARRLRRLPVVAREALAVSLAAQIGTFPLVMAGFGQASLVAPLANALLLPLLGPIMALGLPVAVAGAVFPLFGSLLAFLVYPFLALMIAGVTFLAGLPLAAFPAAAWPMTLSVAYYAVLVLAVWRPLRGHVPATAPAAMQPALTRPALARPWWTAGGVTVVALATLAWHIIPVMRGASSYTLTVLPLGHGQGLLLTTPAGHTLLIDGGDSPSGLDMALGTRLPFWRSHLDTVVLSDVDSVHTAGLRDLPARYTIGREIDPGAVYPPAGYALWRAALRDGGVPEAKLRTGRWYRIDTGASLDVLLPAGLNAEAPDAPTAVRLMLGHLSLLLLNRAALTADPRALVPNGARRDTVLILPAGAATAEDDASLVRLVRPSLVIVPPAADPHDDPAIDATVVRAAHTVGARTWQRTGGQTLQITTDGRSYHAAISAP